MEIKLDRRNIISIVIISVILFGLGFIGGAIAISRANSKRADIIDSRRNREYVEQVGLATEAIRTIDNGLGDVQTSLTTIAASVGSDAKDLRELAQRLRKIASDVASLEDRVTSIRNYSSSFLRDNDNGISDALEETK